MIKLINVPSLYASLYEAVKICRNNPNREINIIVPDKLSLFMEKFLLEKLDISSSFNLKVSTLNRFAKKCCPIAKEMQLTKVASILMIHKILNQNLDRLSVLKSKAYSFDYAENIFRTINQLKASKITFDEMQKFSLMDKQLTDKILDLAFVYEEYEKGKCGMLDASDQFLMSALHVAKGKENSEILFVGFDDFTAIEYSIIEQLSRVANVSILTYFGKGDNKYIYNNEIYSQFNQIARVCDIGFNVEEAEPQVSNLKKFLHKNLFGLKDETFVLDKEPISVFAGDNVSSEIEFVARDLRNKILDGAHYNQFGVAIFDLENNITKIKEIFEKYEINYYIDSELFLNKSIFYKFLCTIFKYNLEGYNLIHIIDLINSPFFKIGIKEKQKLISKLLLLNFRGKISSSLNLGDELEEDKTAFVAFMSSLDFSNLDASACIEKIKQLCLMFDIDDTLQEMAEKCVNLQEKILLKKSEESIFNLFDDILKVNGEISVDELFDIFSHVASVVKINNLPLTLDAVKIVDANNCMEIFDELYVVNCTSQNAPNLKFDCGIILDGEIEKLNFSHKLSPTIAHINKLAKLRLFNLSTMFENSLFITYSNNPSDLVKELLSKIKICIQGYETNLVPIEKVSGEKYVALSHWDYVEAMCKNGENQENIIKNKVFSSISEENLKIFNNFSNISASQLENYFKCPFFYFLGNILKINPRLDSDILSFDIGNVLHEIMFKYYKLNKKVGDIYEFCRNEIFKFVDKDERLKMNANSPILINLIEEAVRVINGLNYIDENSLFQPKFFEFEFKDKTALKLKNISVNGKIDRVDECGDMLRVVDYKSGKADASLKELFYGNKLQLFLYSCAMENIANKKIVGSFYLPLHNAYTRELGNTYSLKGFFLNEDFVVSSFDKRLVAGVKSDIVNAKMNNAGKANRTIGYKELESEELDRLKTYAKKVSEKAVAEIKSGYIKPSPHQISKACDYCPYLQVCLKNLCGVTTRKSEKIDLTSFKED